MFFSSIEEINRLISKAMSNIYLKVTIKKNLHSQNFYFLSLKILSLRQSLESSNSRRYHWILKRLVATLKLEVWGEKCVWLFCYFNFKRNYDVLKSKSLCILLNKNISFNKNQTKQKMENPTHSSSEANLVPSSYKNHK